MCFPQSHGFSFDDVKLILLALQIAPSNSSTKIPWLKVRDPIGGEADPGESVSTPDGEIGITIVCQIPTTWGKTYGMDYFHGTTWYALESIRRTGLQGGLCKTGLWNKSAEVHNEQYIFACRNRDTAVGEYCVKKRIPVFGYYNQWGGGDFEFKTSSVVLCLSSIRPA